MSSESGSSRFLLADWCVEPALGRISRHGDSVRIDPRNMKVLQLLASRAGELVTQAEIETAVWSGLVVTPNSVYQSVAQLRRALGDERARPRFIETISRKGYRLVAPVSWTVADAPTAEVMAPVASLPRRRWRIQIAASAAVLGMLAGTFIVYSRSTSSVLVSTGPESVDAGPLSGTPLNDSAVRAETHFSLATEALRKGEHEIARQHLEQASIAQREVSGYRHPSMAIILTHLADVRRWGGDFAAAELLARESLRILTSTTTEPGVDSVRATTALADALIDAEKQDEAALYLDSALSDARRLFGDGHAATLDAQHSVAMLRLSQGRLDDAEQLARRTMDGYLKLPNASRLTAKFPYALGLALYEQRRYAEAAEESRRELDQLSAMTPRHAAYMALTQHILGRSLNKLGRCQEAEEVFRAELQEWKDLRAPEWRIARASSGLGESLLGQGRLDEAEKQLTYAAERLAQARGWLPRQALQATRERLEQLRDAQRMQDIRQAQNRETL